MPRMIDVLCPHCGTVEEIDKEMDYFEDEDAPVECTCPDCGYLYRRELPPLVRLHLQKESVRTALTHKWKLADETTPLPEEVRKLLAKELFDPCSCGDHAPADIDSHEPDCHVHGHSFMKKPLPSCEQE
ncbi:MAG: hypothetical protein HQM11_00785 [SAR324 cluster bacterium]|nr:hypothetical protein [SAR324 cluster bacterium]